MSGSPGWLGRLPLLAGVCAARGCAVVETDFGRVAGYYHRQVICHLTSG